MSDPDVFRSSMADFVQHCPPAARVVVVAGGSGSGKTTLTKMLLARHPDKFIWLRRSTTRPPRAKDRDEDAMHRFMSIDEFEACTPYLYGVTRPYGYLYGFLLDDILAAMHSGKTWLTNVMVHRTELGTFWPHMKVRSIGISPVRLSEQEATGADEHVRTVIQRRLLERDKAISQDELVARVDKACRDTEFVCRSADRIVVNSDDTSLERAYASVEEAALVFHRVLNVGLPELG